MGERGRVRGLPGVNTNMRPLIKQQLFRDSAEITSKYSGGFLRATSVWMRVGPTDRFGPDCGIMCANGRGRRGKNLQQHAGGRQMETPVNEDPAGMLKEIRGEKMS
jgi:hypothetical protein